MSDTLTKFSYQTFQQGKAFFGQTHKILVEQISNILLPKFKQRMEEIPNELLLQLQQKYNNLLEIDWQDAEAGVYPKALLFDNRWEDFFLMYPMIWLDITQILNRLQKSKYQNFSPAIETDGYPGYYLQNFHHQSDGYLSDMSANLYDLQVELLFNGTSDAMRRRVLAPLKQGLKVFQSVRAHKIRILDVACGTGHTLKMIRSALPKASLYGTDLSPAYLRKANEILSQIPGELPQLLQANAEKLPYVDNYFHAVTSVFLFHELPATVRQTVINECFRVTKPGGMFIICDSIQLDDSPEMGAIMHNFHTQYHEPYYKHYINDNLVARLEKAGFANIETQTHFLSKYWIAHKPE
ncbi:MULTISPECIES: class I SAM-dependent methyltransferase [Calothrix]|uniref:Methyltransferase domain-containing protein n=2 Tax=Calothrix TaxID=1186 RepID=A0ABR8A3M8_9CYAN|nr:MULTISPECIES: class I SAM-dependent methyltransferase [Calothrix]MBD2194368.1 methyltransferase domain-containing protein [Calothrix parietina FACHB-288]MBD2223150.1 methyltransferase domain-containing protein [Calothrix anomala FACHB-343]